MTRSRRSIVITISCCAALVGAFVRDARASVGQDKKLPRYVQRWTAVLQENDLHLQAGEWELAEREARDLIDRMVHRPGLRLLEPIGAATYQHALALAGLGRLDEAHWQADVARAFHPSIPVEQLQSNYGEPGRLVSKWFRDAAAQWDPVDSASIECGAKAQEADPELAPPKKVSGEEPQPTVRLRRQGGGAAISFVVDEQGVPHAPKLLVPERANIALLWAMLEAYRDWRFEPGNRADQPVACRYTLMSFLQ